MTTGMSGLTTIIFIRIRIIMFLKMIIRSRVPISTMGGLNSLKTTSYRKLLSLCRPPTQMLRETVLKNRCKSLQGNREEGQASEQTSLGPFITQTMLTPGRTHKDRLRWVRRCLRGSKLTTGSTTFPTLSKRSTTLVQRFTQTTSTIFWLQVKGQALFTLESFPK